MKNYDVIIVGGGPTGVALGIELGLNNIKTLILEKHLTPLLSPRAQSLNARSMEFFMRWKIADKLKSKQLLPPDFPIRGVWCSKLNGKTYAISSSNEQLNDDISPQRGIRIPLWITEEVLRERLKDFPSITFLKQQNVIDLKIKENFVEVISQNNAGESEIFTAKYAVGCDGANSITRKKAGIEFEQLSPSQRIINIMFESLELEKQITVEKGFLFYLLETVTPGALGPVDLSRGLWYAQIKDNSDVETINQLNIDKILEDLVGFAFNKEIVQAHFWDMHIQLAKAFSKENCVFLVGDSAHAFVPTGGFGLNTGLGDVINLGSKLAAVLKERAHPSLLEEYEEQRRPICINNLRAAQKNAEGIMETRKKHNPDKEPEEFARANAELAKQFANSIELTMGYSHFETVRKRDPIKAAASYQPIVKPGYFLPHRWIEGRSIYEILSPIDWTFIICGLIDSNLLELLENHTQSTDYPIKFLHFKKDVYPYKYIVITPDWHIFWVSDEEETAKLFILSLAKKALPN